MENRLRDLEYIQERDPRDPGRRIGAILLATLAVLGLTFAMGIFVGRAAKPERAAQNDPFARLRSDSVLPAQNPGDTPTDGEHPAVAPEPLIFHKVLAEEDARPEVAEALVAAAAEEAELAALAGESRSEGVSDPSRASLSPPAAGSDGSPPAPDGTFDTARGRPEIEPSPPRLPPSLPAAAAAGDASANLARTAPLDPLVSAALRQNPPDSKTPPGHEGEFTLQVISYDQPAPAYAFAQGLRARGHNAFVVRADVAGRGRFFRVRIGPFKSKWKAELYRRKFEEQERMNTYVVRRPPPEV